MNARNGLILLLLISLGFVFQGCDKDDCVAEVTYVQYIPVWMTPEDVRQPVEVEAPRPLGNTGKIYYYQNYILVNEIREGIHVIDNSNPASPSNLGFIKILGNVDMAVKGNILYADNFMDLLAIDFTDPMNAILVKRVEEVFPLNGNDGEGNWLVYYDQKLITEDMDCNRQNVLWNGGFWLDNGVFATAEANAQTGGANAPAGVGGSMARFTLYDNYLYAVDQSNLRVFSVADIACPNLVSTVNAGWGIETIFPYGENLFLGSESGMFIFDNSDPANPTYLSVFRHATACDPVFVKDNYAYVTLRDGTFCQGFSNQLDLVDITSLTNPSLVETFPMHNPHGLSILDNSLFVCEGDEGLKAFDIADPLILDEKLTDHIKGFHAFDVIALPNGLLMIIGEDGLYQYDASNPDDLQEVSVIPVLRS
ncbi:MAG: hypothetical protein AAF502_11785 [Bacteroidota bacterium]